LVARLVESTDFFLHRLNLNAKLVHLARVFVVLVNHLPIPLGQSLRNLLDRISEGPESIWLALVFRHIGTTQLARGIERKRE
jgi:hypothetical protein